MIVQSLSGAAIQSGGLDPLGVAVERVKMSSSVPENAGDPFFESATLAGTSSGEWYEYILSSVLGETLTYECMHPAVAEIIDGRVVKVGTGGIFKVIASRNGRQQFILGTTKSNAATVTAFNGYVDDSAAKIMSDGILGLITGTEDINLFSNWSTAAIGTPAPALVKNTNCWANGVDLSGIPIQTTLKGRWGSENKGALITPRHVVGALHWNNYTGGFIGMKFRFRGLSGTVYERTVIGMTSALLDVVLFTLDSALPEDVTPVKVIGEWFGRNRVYSGISCATYNGGVFFYVDQTYSCRLVFGASFTDLESHYAPSSETVNGNTYSSMLWRAEFSAQTEFSGITPAFITGKTSYFREGISGDSGSPVLTLIDNAPVLVGTWYYPTTAPFLGEADGALLNDIIALSDANAGISTGLTVTVAPDPTL